MNPHWVKIFIVCLLACSSNSVYDYYEGDFEEEQDYNEIATETSPTDILSRKEFEGNATIIS